MPKRWYRDGPLRSNSRPCSRRQFRLQQTVEFRNVSKFYGEVLGVNRVNLVIPPGITSLVGPNGSGKTTLMNLVTGLIRPDLRRRASARAYAR